MSPSSSDASTGACPASALILAVRQAKTPLAIAQAPLSDATILFANDAFAAMLDCDPDTLLGHSLNALGGAAMAPTTPGSPVRLQLRGAGGQDIPVALSVAVVPGFERGPTCLLCSLIDARGEGADAAIARDAELLAEVAHAAGELMSESALAASQTHSDDAAMAAAGIAFDAVAHVTRLTTDGRS